MDKTDEVPALAELTCRTGQTINKYLLWQAIKEAMKKGAAGKRSRHDKGCYFIEGGLNGLEQISECREEARHADI